MGIPTCEDVATAVARHVGGRVRCVTRQRRWRPTWFVETICDGEELNLVVRAERVDTMVFPLEHEMRFHAVLEANEIPVPKLYGWIDELGAMVMEMVPGRPDFDGVAVVVDRMSVPYLSGAMIDFVDSIEKQGFTIDNPNATGSCACGDSFH